MSFHAGKESALRQAVEQNAGLEVRTYQGDSMKTVQWMLWATLPLCVGCATVNRHEKDTDAQVLPLRSVRLYETGIGYFERAGVLGSKPTVLPVPAGHLDDALKTLLVLSQGAKSPVFGVEFASSVSPGMGRALAGLSAAEEAPIDFQHLLSALKGSVVEVRHGKTVVQGRLVDVLPEGKLRSPEADAEADKKKDDTRTPSATPSDKANGKQLLLLTDRGELVRLSLSEVTTVRPLDPTFAQRLRTALSATSQSGRGTERMLRLLSRNGGAVDIAYLAEAPLWRVSYRLVVADSGKGGTLQGWALIHNDTDEDWRSVRVHLLSGRPDSFLFPLAAPRYTRRPLITPENQLSTVPQLLSENADKLWGDHVGDSYGAGGLGLSGMGAGGGGTGEGTIGLGSIGTIGHGSGTGSGSSSTSTSSLLSIGQLAPTTSASGVEAGSLFAYSLGEPLDLRAHGSALLPFVYESVDVEQITWLPSPGEPARSSLRLQNTTKQTIPEGTLAVFSDAGLLGETVLPRLKPGERRIVEYGFELDVEAKRNRQTQKDDTQRLAFSDDRFEEHFVRRRDQVYVLLNRSMQPRHVYMPLGVSMNTQIQGADRLEVVADKGGSVAVFELPPQSKVERPIVTMEGLSRKTDLRGLQASRLFHIASLSTVPASERSIAAEAAARQKEWEDAGKELDKLRSDVKKAEKDLERLREHLKALGSAAAGGTDGNPLLKRILETEDRLSATQKRVEILDADQEKRKDAVRKVLERLPKPREAQNP
jgi:hypothetical protein